MEVKAYDVVLCKFYFSDAKQFKNRPVLVFKDNLPHDDFIGIPISSKIDKIYEDELLIDNEKFEVGSIVRVSKLMIRKTFVISKVSVLKKYGTLNKKSYDLYHKAFCKYFGCK
jgi:mRNA interferase MazF